jgi:dolichol-phosphate mannosyltransferase
MILSVIIPTYKCSDSISELAHRLINSIAPITEDYEILFVNDASPDNDWEVIKILTQNHHRIKGINLSRNFGQHYAITAGLANASGDWIVIMDGDLQDRPEEISNLYNKAQHGYDIVLAQRVLRQDRLVKRLSSALFYKIFSYLTDTRQDGSVANFGIYKKTVIQAVLSMNDSIKFFPTMLQWVGFNKAFLPVQHDKRTTGNSSYSLGKLFQLAFDNLIAFSNKPLLLVVKFGFFIVAMSMLAAGYFLVKYLQGDIVVLGYSSLIISIWFLSGITIMILGIVGIYVGKTFEKVKDRPNYIIQEKQNI